MKGYALSDGRYNIALEYSSEIGTDSGAYHSPRGKQPGRIVINPEQPEFDLDVALLHEINHHIAWTRNAQTFTSHTALDYHATGLLALFRHSPRLVEHFCLFHKKGR